MSWVCSICYAPRWDGDGHDCQQTKDAAPDSWPAGDCLRCETEATQASCQEPHTCTSDAAPDSRPASFTRDPIAGEPRPGDPWPEIALRHAETVNLEAVYRCNICGAEFPGNGFIHYCRRTPDAPSAGGPGGIDLDDTLTKLWKFSKIKPRTDGVETIVEVKLEQLHLLHDHIERLTVENASLRSEKARLAGEVSSLMNLLCDEHHMTTAIDGGCLMCMAASAVGTATLKALEAARAVSPNTNWLDAEIQRLQAAPGGEKNA